MNFLAHYQGAYDAFKKKRQQEHHWRTMDRDDGGVDHDHSLCQDPLTHWNKKKEGLSRKEGRRRYDFSHNDYLGLSSHPYVLKRAMDVAGKFGCGSRASRLLRDNGLYDPLEQLLCKAKGMEKALVFPSGYQANVAVLSTLLSQRILNKRCHVFVDALIHRSLIDGILLSKSNLQRFYHQDLDHLESMLEKNDDPDAFLAIVVESIYSMDGDRAPLSQYSELAKKYHAMLIVDDAHSMGLFGEAGNGLASKFMDDGIAVMTGTLSKALGGQGGFVCCDHWVYELLINASPGFMYSTGMSPLLVGAATGSMEMLPQLDSIRSKVSTMARNVKKELTSMGFDLGSSTSHILPIMVGDTQKAILWQAELKKKSIIAALIRPPTVAVGTSRLRINITGDHDETAMDALLETMEEIKDVCVESTHT